MPRSAHIASALLAVFGVMLLLQALWASVGPRWFPSAQFLADLHTTTALQGLLVSAFGFFSLAWGLLRKYRWAWLAAAVWTLAWAGLLSAVVFIFIFGETAASENLLYSFARDHPLEIFLGTVAAGTLFASLAHLWRKEVRTYFLMRLRDW
jgi:hypothetical protein